MVASSRSRACSSRQLLLYAPALVLCAVTVFFARWLVTRGSGDGLGVNASVVLVFFLFGTSAAAWSVPTAVCSWQRSPRPARSVFWRTAVRAAMLQCVGGWCMAVGLLFLLWRLVPGPLAPFWSVVLAVVSLVVGLELWRLGAKMLQKAPQVSRAALREAHSYLRKRSSAKNRPARKQRL